jgi:hypothetical protein
MILTILFHVDWCCEHLHLPLPQSSTLARAKLMTTHSFVEHVFGPKPPRAPLAAAEEPKSFQAADHLAARPDERPWRRLAHAFALIDEVLLPAL